jgi:hypothetical protein
MAPPRIQPAIKHPAAPQPTKSVISDEENKRIWAQALREVAAELLPLNDAAPPPPHSGP